MLAEIPEAYRTVLILRDLEGFAHPMSQRSQSAAKPPFDGGWRKLERCFVMPGNVEFVELKVRN